MVFFYQQIILFLTIVHRIQTYPSSLTLGFLGPTNLPNINTQTIGHPALRAFKLAIDDINNRSDLLPHTNLTYVINNTNSDVGNATIEAFWQCVYGNVIGLAGEYISAISQSIQYVSRYYKVPQISYGSTSSEFTRLHSTHFPYFLRTTPAQSLQSTLLAYLIASQGWKHIALIYTTNTQIFHDVQIFLTVARKLNITVLASTSFAPDTTNLTTQMLAIKQSRARIILFFGSITDQRIVIDNSLTEGLTGVGYQWAQGFIGLQMHVDRDSDVYKEYARQWATAPYDPETSTIDPYSISPIATFAYDACLMFAHALHQMIEVLHVDPMKIENRDLYLAVLHNVSFFGVSGHVSVDQNGDRPVNSFDIVNFQHDRIVEIGLITDDGQAHYFPNIQITYMGGTDMKPLDLPIRPLITISQSTVIGMIAGSSACTLLCLGLIIFTCYFRQHPVMKASSPLFLVLMLMGVLSLALSVIPRTLENHHPLPALCIIELWLSNIGYSLIIGTLLLKTYRLSTIFHMAQANVKHHLKDAYLLLILFGLMVLSSAMLAGLCLGDPFYLPLAPFDSISDYQYCTSKRQLTVYVPLILSTRFALLLLTAICAYRIRKIPDMFNETRQLVFTIYNLLFVSIAVPAIDLTMDRGKSWAMIAHGMSIFVICILTTLIMFVPKLVLVRKMDERKKCCSSTFVFTANNSTTLTNRNRSSETPMETH